MCVGMRRGRTLELQAWRLVLLLLLLLLVGGREQRLLLVLRHISGWGEVLLWLLLVWRRLLLLLLLLPWLRRWRPGRGQACTGGRHHLTTRHPPRTHQSSRSTRSTKRAGIDQAHDTEHVIRASGPTHVLAGRELGRAGPTGTGGSMRRLLLVLLVGEVGGRRVAIVRALRTTASLTPIASL